MNNIMVKLLTGGHYRKEKRSMVKRKIIDSLHTCKTNLLSNFKFVCVLYVIMYRTSIVMLIIGPGDCY